MKRTPYLNIHRLKEKYAYGFTPGDHIVIQEKIDGSNFSFCYDEEKDAILSFSHSAELNERDTLRGAYQWACSLDKELVRRVLGTHLIVFSEWLVLHTNVYPEECYRKAYCYDVYDTREEKYLPQSRVKEIIQALGLIYVPVFYDGEFHNWEEVFAFIGKTELGGDGGEGIVVKNMSKLNSKKEMFYVKLVADKFLETKDMEPMKTNKVLAIQETNARVASVVTKARVQKLLHKMVDDGILSQDWGEAELPLITQKLGGAIFHDCLKEEPELVNSVKNFGKYAKSEAMLRVKEILKDAKG